MGRRAFRVARRSRPARSAIATAFQAAPCAAVREFGVTITAISPGLFKIPFLVAEPPRSNLGWMDAGFYRSWDDARVMLDDHVKNLLPQALDFAGDVGASQLIVFSLHRAGVPSGPAPDGIVDMLGHAAEAAAARDTGLSVETEEGHRANTGAPTAELVERVAHRALAVNWDPANAQIGGDVAYPNGYAAVRHHVRNVHFKDVRCHRDGSRTLVEDGDVDWQGQVRALIADGYRGAIAVERHLAPSVSSTRIARLRSLIDAAGAG